MKNKYHKPKKYGMLQPKMEKSDIVFQGHGMCGSGGFISNKGTSQKNSLLDITMLDPEINKG
jgi:hypothetical protein